MAYETDADLDFLPESQSVLSTASTAVENIDFDPSNNYHNIEPSDYDLSEGRHLSSKQGSELHGANQQDVCQSASNIKPLPINSVSADEYEHTIEVDDTNGNVGQDRVLRFSEVVITKLRARRALSELPGDLSALPDFIDRVPTNVVRRFSFPYYSGRTVYSLKNPCESSDDNLQEPTSPLRDQNVSSSGSIELHMNCAFAIASPFSHAPSSTGDLLGAMYVHSFSPLRDVQPGFHKPLVDPGLCMQLTPTREYNTANLPKSVDSEIDELEMGIGLSAAPVIVLPSSEHTAVNTNLSLLEGNDVIRSWATLVNCNIGSNFAPDRRFEVGGISHNRDDCETTTRSGYIVSRNEGQALCVKLDDTMSSYSGTPYPLRRRTLDSFSCGVHDIDSDCRQASDIYISGWQHLSKIPPRLSSCPPLMLPIQLALLNSMGETLSDHNSFNGDSGSGTVAHGSSGGPQQHTSVISFALLDEILDALNISSSITSSTSQDSQSGSSYSSDDPETVCKNNLASDSTISWGIAF
ncbi:hypothetical protein HYPSUDRAFT_203701 [Hypholoma sublateritium FD-334 SS-4]|uniref:Uncharacterized protein n=1 Tax=Hypholoma sublateritium (strain FD-334 SS-4) TaxID=945553 RepID=A0A0D2NP30_HYPSF|nr:hypothetical protein HYPSUDRAFT_203701 [Hypholoma sublateritium FD-334 SS-4]